MKEEYFPNLRFPEFISTWNSVSLNSISTISSGLTCPQVGYVTPYKVSRIETISSGFINLEKVGYIEGDENIQSFKLNIGDILFSNINSLEHIGKNAYVSADIDLYHGMNLLRIITNKNNYSKFLFYFINTYKCRKSFRERANQAVNQASINQTELGKTPVKIPEYAEQQKIADCLSSLDELIEAHEQKRDALVEHKKGLMQRLFPTEGETTPRWRFPEFRKAGEWEQKRLGEICKTFSGGTPSTSNKAYYGGEIPFIRSAEINKTKTELFLTEIGLKNSSAKLVDKGDILLALYGANSGEVAISKMSGAINQAILCLRTHQNNVFIFQYLFYKKDYFISKYLQGGQGNFSAEIVKAMDIPLPILSEQQKIADCLSSLDSRIEAEETKIASLREHKQGLMQRLFPQSL